MIKFLKFIPVQLTFFLIVGILIGNWFSFDPIQLAFVVLFLLLALSFLFIHSKEQFYPSIVFSLVVFLISIFIGISAITFKNQANQELHYSNSSSFSMNKPMLVSIQIRAVLKPSINYSKYEANVVQLNSKKAIGRVLVQIRKDSIVKPFQVDDSMLIKSSFLSIQKPLNPYGFNYKSYLQKQQIHHQIYVNNGQYLVLQKKSSSIRGIAAIIRTSINKSLKANGFKNDELAVINALLLGQKNTVTRELLNSYAGAGAIHILAVSGLHVGIILLLLTFLLKPLHYFKHGKLMATLLIIVLLWIYAIIAGLSPSVVRAVTMFTALTVGMQLIKRSNVYQTLVISMFFLLLFNPYYLFEVGFQLSYLAVFSIVWIQPMLYRFWKPKFWLPKKMWQLFTVSLAAQLGVLPLSLYYFHQFPGLFFLSNLVIIPFLGVILIVGILVISLSVIEMLPQFVAESYSFIIQQMNGFVSWISAQDLFIIQNISFSLLMMLAFYNFIVVSVKWFEKKRFYRFVLLLISVIIIQSIVIFEKYTLESSEEFIIFNSRKSTILGIRKGSNFLVNATDTLVQNEYVLKPYLIESKTGEDLRITSLKNSYKFKNETILVVDSLGIYDFKTIKPSMVLLQNSPKVNLERLLKKMHPKLIIVDGSNYKSYVKSWEQTCIKNNTPFYNTMQKGAYILK